MKKLSLLFVLSISHMLEADNISTQTSWEKQIIKDSIWNEKNLQSVLRIITVWSDYEKMPILDDCYRECMKNHKELLHVFEDFKNSADEEEPENTMHLFAIQQMRRRIAELFERVKKNTLSTESEGKCEQFIIEEIIKKNQAKGN